jgi:hypothetical protein
LHGQIEASSGRVENHFSIAASDELSATEGLRNLQREALLKRLKRISHHGLLLCLGLLALTLPAAEPVDFQGSAQMTPFDEEIIDYPHVRATDPVAVLKRKLDYEEIKLKADEKFGLLPSLLKELKIPQSSQMLVFSKTSLQRHLIGPKNPRALFFNDDVYVGYIPGSQIIEIASSDSKLGAVFYTLDQTDPVNPRLRRDNQCLECHASTRNMGVPGHLARSFIPDEEGKVDMFSGSMMVNHKTPFEKRWSGWYVTGESGKMVHNGNLMGEAAFKKQEAEPGYLSNQKELKHFFDTAKYPQGGSDIVALMTFEHQAHLHNFITRLNYETRIHLTMYQHTRHLHQIVDGFVRYLLFADEVPLPNPVKGTSSFAEEFQQLGPRDSKGRSLRDLDLQTRLLKYPCSYLIYSDPFTQMPPEAKELVYRRLHEVLTGKETGEAYARVTKESRQAIREILLETKKDLPAYWRE